MIKSDALDLLDKQSDLIQFLSQLGTYTEEECEQIARAYQELMQYCSSREIDRECIYDAFKLAADAHKDARRKSGEPYIFHPIAVAKIVAEDFRMDAIAVIAALLHDVVEDTNFTLQDIESYFRRYDDSFGAIIVASRKEKEKEQKPVPSSKVVQEEVVRRKGKKAIDKTKPQGQPTPADLAAEAKEKIGQPKEIKLSKLIAHIVDGLTKIKGSFEEKPWIEKQAENVRRILLTLGEDIRVILIKIADRLHNMRTLGAQRDEKRRQIAAETLYLYAPIAHRLGLYKVKSELEDLSMKYTVPNLYKEIASKLQDKKNEREEYIQAFIKPVEQRLKEVGITNFRIFGRPKHIYSIYNKIKNQKVSFEDIYDLFAIRIIVDVPFEKDYETTRVLERRKCWSIFSEVSSLYASKNERLRDWITYPKGNGYESLHCTVMNHDAKWVEVQIRTERMDEIAERGVAAHWKYKGSNSQSKFDQWLEQIRDFLSSRDNENALQMVTDFSYNLWENDIYVFTPKGDLHNLPAGSSILDFAFEIHTDLGCSCIGAKIENKLYPISHVLKSGDQVTILTSKKQKPTLEWLNFTKTSKARAKIKSVLNSDRRQQAESGKEILERKMRNLKLPFNSNVINELVNYFHFPDSLELFCQIADGTFDVAQLKQLSFNGDQIEIKKDVKKESIASEAGSSNMNIATSEGAEFSIFMGFANQIDYSIAKCCNPVAGDDVFGFLTQGRGITLHHMKCPNADALMSRYPYRIIQKIKWQTQSKDLLFLANLKITGIDDVGLVHKFTNVISNELKINMRSVTFDARDGIFHGEVGVFVKDAQHLNLLMKKLREIPGVYSVEKIEGIGN